jgi:hypothetical protein
MANEGGSVTTPPGRQPPRGWAVVLQVAVLVIALPAVTWGAYLLFGMALPSRCGDFSGAATLGVAASWAVNLPVGLLALGVGLTVKSGSSLLRKICIGTSIITLSLPVIAIVFLHLFHCH